MARAAAKISTAVFVALLPDPMATVFVVDIDDLGRFRVGRFIVAVAAGMVMFAEAVVVVFIIVVCVPDRVDFFGLSSVKSIIVLMFVVPEKDSLRFAGFEVKDECVRYGFFSVGG